VSLPSHSLIHSTFGGSLPGDIWRCNIWTQPDTLTEPDLTQAQLDSYADAILAKFNTTAWNPATGPLKTKNLAVVNLSQITCTEYNSGTAYQHSNRSITAVPGNGSAGQNAGWISCCVSLLTDVNSRRTRGRMYVPVTAISVSSTDLQWQQGDLDQITTDIAAFLTGIGSIAWPTGTLPISEPVVVSRIGSGQAHVISNVRTDSLVDTQRGRQNRASALRFSSHAV